MGHTNSTANLSLPQFIGTDKPTWLGDVNGAFSAIDSYAGTNDAAVAAAASDASSAISQAAAAVNTANTANTTAGNASTAATAAVTAANQANALSNQVSLRTGVLANLHTTDKTSIVNAINEVADAQTDYTVIDTAVASATYAAQLTQLETAFDGLSVDQKRKAVIIVDNAGTQSLIFRVQDLSNKMFSTIFGGSSGAGIATFRLNAQKALEISIASDGTISFTDVSANTNTNALILAVM